MATEKQKKAVKYYSNLYNEYVGQYLYIIKCHEYYKIGTTFNLDNRVNTLQCGNPYEIELIWAVRISDYKECEMLLHKHFASKRHSREWFLLTEDDIKSITSLVDMG